MGQERTKSRPGAHQEWPRNAPGVGQEPARSWLLPTLFSGRHGQVFRIVSASFPYSIRIVGVHYASNGPKASSSNSKSKEHARNRPGMD